MHRINREWRRSNRGGGLRDTWLRAGKHQRSLGLVGGLNSGNLNARLKLGGRIAAVVAGLLFLCKVHTSVCHSEKLPIEPDMASCEELSNTMDFLRSMLEKTEAQGCLDREPFHPGPSVADLRTFLLEKKEFREKEMSEVNALQIKNEVLENEVGQLRSLALGDKPGGDWVQARRAGNTAAGSEKDTKYFENAGTSKNKPNIPENNNKKTTSNFSDTPKDKKDISVKCSETTKVGKKQEKPSLPPKNKKVDIVADIASAKNWIVEIDFEGGELSSGSEVGSTDRLNVPDNLGSSVEKELDSNIEEKDWSSAAQGSGPSVPASKLPSDSKGEGRSMPEQGSESESGKGGAVAEDGKEENKISKEMLEKTGRVFTKGGESWDVKEEGLHKFPEKERLGTETSFEKKNRKSFLRGTRKKDVHTADEDAPKSFPDVVENVKQGEEEEHPSSTTTLKEATSKEPSEKNSEDPLDESSRAPFDKPFEGPSKENSEEPSEIPSEKASEDSSEKASEKASGRSREDEDPKSPSFVDGASDGREHLAGVSGAEAFNEADGARAVGSNLEAEEKENQEGGGQDRGFSSEREEKKDIEREKERKVMVNEAALGTEKAELKDKSEVAQAQILKGLGQTSAPSRSEKVKVEGTDKKVALEEDVKKIAVAEARIAAAELPGLALEPSENEGEENTSVGAAGRGDNFEQGAAGSRMKISSDPGSSSGTAGQTTGDGEERDDKTTDGRSRKDGAEENRPLESPGRSIGSPSPVGSSYQYVLPTDDIVIDDDDGTGAVEGRPLSKKVFSRDDGFTDDGIDDDDEKVAF